MSRYETLDERTRSLGTTGYLEVARKRLVEGEVSTTFLLLTRGVVDEVGEKRWTRFVTLPDDPEVVAWLTESLRALRGPPAPPTPPARG